VFCFEGYFVTLLRVERRVLAKFKYYYITNKRKGKAVPLQAWSGPEGSRKLRFPDYMTTAAFTPGNAPGTHFC
jgi:hypothetical protein